MKTLCSFLLLTIAFASQAQPFAKGAKVDVYATDGKYYGATVIETDGDQYKVRYLGYGPDKDVWVRESSLVRGGKKGERVAVIASTGRFTGVIEEVSIDQYKIKYDGYPDLYTLTRDQFHLDDTPAAVMGSHETSQGKVTVSNSTRPAREEEGQATVITNPFVVGGKIEALEGTTWYQATIKEIKDGKYLVKYDGYSQEDWLPIEKLRRKTMLPADKLKPTGGKTYIRSIRWIATGNTELSWFFLGDNGVIVSNPMYGLNPVNLSMEQVENWRNVGTYTISNNKIDITWLNGRTTSMALKYSGGDIVEMDAGGMMMRQKGLPENFRLNGTYSGSISAGGIGSFSEYTFGRDGTVSTKRTGTVTAGVTGGISEDEKRGTYTIRGNTLTINFMDGTKEVSNIGIFNLGPNHNLVINGRWMKSL